MRFAFVLSSCFYSLSFDLFLPPSLSLSLSLSHTHSHTYVDLTSYFVITLKHCLISSDIAPSSRLASMTPLVIKVQLRF